MVFNGLLIIFDIRIPVKKLQHIVSSILGPVTVYRLLYSYMFALEQKLRVHCNGLQKTFIKAS